MDVENAKKILFESEPRAIYLRTQKIESKLQDILQKYNSILLTENELQKLNKNQGILLFKIKVDMQEQLKFLDEWKGLKIQTPQQLTQDEYNKKVCYLYFNIFNYIFNIYIFNTYIFSPEIG